ncbi:MAG: LuxR C-terminal-related transcriptional regulator [Gammaproteobacteria bacterium]|nr:LuxR C-terminal-related transcriptional regulator [Gammaproteobacteria bacterium]MCH9743846.1 LuxR C-terminal-related transcriptional regulator [Gammaproteobacteria bacterium]
MFVANDISLWKHNTNNEIWADGANQFDLDNGISIRRHDIDFTDTYCFYSNKNSPHMNQFYFDNMNLLMMFINYFLVQIRPILARQYYERIVTPPCYMTTSHSPLLNEPTSHIDVDEFINSIRNSNNKDSFNESIKALSEREVQCILLFAEGLTTNEAAEKLNLSPRTIESHISNARIKLDCKNVVSLVAKYMRNNIN